MQPQNNPQAGFNLPPVMPEALPPAGPSEATPSQPEMLPQAPEIASIPATQMPALTPPAQPQIVPTAAPSALPADVSKTTTPLAKLTADDSDLVEKEWVNKAKKIVEQTQDDPFQQSTELSGLKADYLQQRYNKQVKLNE